MKFIKLTLSVNEKPTILVNISLCIDIYRKDGGHSTQLSFNNDYILSVTETPEEIVEILNEY